MNDLYLLLFLQRDPTVCMISNWQLHQCFLMVVVRAIWYISFARVRIRCAELGLHVGLRKHLVKCASASLPT